MLRKMSKTSRGGVHNFFGPQIFSEPKFFGVTPNCLPSKKATQKRLLYKVYSIKATQNSLLKKGYIDKKGYLIK